MGYNDDDLYDDYDDDDYDDDDYDDDDEEVSSSSSVNPFSRSGSTSSLPGRDRTGGSRFGGQSSSSSSGSRFGGGSKKDDKKDKGRSGSSRFGGQSSSSGSSRFGGGSRDDDKRDDSQSGGSRFGGGSKKDDKKDKGRSGSSRFGGQSSSSGSSRFGGGSRDDDKRDDSKSGSSRFGGGSKKDDKKDKGRSGSSRFGGQSSSSGSSRFGGGSRDDDKRDDSKSGSSRFGGGSKKDDKKDKGRSGSSRFGGQSSSSGSSRFGGGSRDDDKRDDSKSGSSRFGGGSKKDDKKDKGRSGSSRFGGQSSSSGSSRFGSSSRGDDKDDSPSTGRRFGAALGGMTGRFGGGKKDDADQDSGAKKSSGGRFGRFSRGKKDDQVQDDDFRSGSTSSPYGARTGSGSRQQSSFGGTRSQSKQQRGRADSGKQTGKKGKGDYPKPEEETKAGVFSRFSSRLPFGGQKTETKKSAARSKTRKVPKVREDAGFSLDAKLDFIGVVMLFVSIGLFLSTISGNQGKLTGGINGIFTDFFGWGALGVHITMAAIGIWLIIRHFGDEAPEIDPVRVSGLGVLYVGLLMVFMLIESFNPMYGGATQASFTDVVRQSVEEGRGGGFVGAEIYAALVSNLGEISAIIFVLGWLVIGVMLATRTTAGELAVFVMSVWRSFTAYLDQRSQKRRALALEQQALTQQQALSVSAPEVGALPAGSQAALPASSGGAERLPIEQRPIPIKMGGRQMMSQPAAQPGAAQPAPIAPPPGIPDTPVNAPDTPVDAPGTLVDAPGTLVDAPGTPVVAGKSGSRFGGLGRRLRGAMPVLPARSPKAVEPASIAPPPAQVPAQTPTQTPDDVAASAPATLGGLLQQSGAAPQAPEQIPDNVVTSAPTTSVQRTPFAPASPNLTPESPASSLPFSKPDATPITPPVAEAPAAPTPVVPAETSPEDFLTGLSASAQASPAEVVPRPAQGAQSPFGSRLGDRSRRSDVTATPAETPSTDVDSPFARSAKREATPLAQRASRLDALRSGQGKRPTDDLRLLLDDDDDLATPPEDVLVAPVETTPKAESPLPRPAGNDDDDIQKPFVPFRRSTGANDPLKSSVATTSPQPVTPPQSVVPPPPKPAAFNLPSAGAATPPATFAAERDNRPEPVINRPRPTETPSKPSPVISRGQQSWRLPDYRTLLASGSDQDIKRDMLVKRARVIEETLASFGAPGRVVEINTGPVITQFGVEPDYLMARGGKKSRVKVGSIAALDRDLQLSLGAKSIRIEAPVPGKGYVGIEVPNDEAALVSLRDVMESKQFTGIKSPLTIALGQSVDGSPVSADLIAMPHLLIAGTTGSGKSVCVNSIIASLSIRNTPEHVKFIMVDPKRVELTNYNGLPHLVAPVVVELERIIGVLKWVTREMDHRYKTFSSAGARNIEDFNAHKPDDVETMPYIVVIIDELADLMMLAPDETERVITRIAALARATGIHLVIATQRPSVDVVTGLIKANFPARIAFAVASGVDSRVILDQPGADKLLGRGDMLYLSGDSPAPLRLQGVFVSDMEINNINRFWRTQGTGSKLARPAPALVLDDTPEPESQPEPAKTNGDRFVIPPSGDAAAQQVFWDETSPDSAETHSAGFGMSNRENDGHEDELYEEAVEMVRRLKKASVSLLQRRLRIGYTRAARLVDKMEADGIVGPPTEGSKPREVLPFKSK